MLTLKFVLILFFVELCVGELASECSKWPRGTVPYTVDQVSKFSPHELNVIVDAMQKISVVANCITFTNIGVGHFKGDFLIITSLGLGDKTGKGCWADVGRQGGRQALNLDEGCVTPTKVFKLLARVLGANAQYIRYVFNQAEPRFSY